MAKAGQVNIAEVQSDLLCCAFEGGSNYWYMIEEVKYPEGMSHDDFKFPHIEVPFKEGGAIIISVPEDGDGKKYKLDAKAIRKGWRLMASDCVRHYADAITENSDATTGDVFLQLCLFGEVIFG